MLRASAAAEKAGIPSVTIIGSSFMRQAALVSKGLGLTLPVAEYPGAPMVDSDAELRRKVEAHLLPAVITGLTQPRIAETTIHQPPADPLPGSVVFSGTLPEVEEYFHHQLWSDGLPIIPPTQEAVAAFLAFTARDRNDLLGTLPQEGREATILSIAINGVMAGCRPEYMPVLIAIVEVIADPQFRIEDAGSTPAWEPLVIISGPIIKTLDINHGAGVMRIGRQANSSIGRFLRLYMRNICGYRIAPGDGDKGSIGYTFNVALAEDEQWSRDIGWPTFGEDLGFAADDNVVTIQSVVCISPPTYSSGTTATGHAQQFVDAIYGAFSYWAYSGLKRGYWHSVLVIGPSIAKVIAKEWSKDQLRDFLVQQATMPASTMKHYATKTGGLALDFEGLVKEGLLQPDYITSSDPDRLVRMIVAAKHIGIVVAGDPGRNQSRGYMANHSQGTRTSKRIELPKDWSQRLAALQRPKS